MWNIAILPFDNNLIETGTSSEESNTVRFAKIGKEEKIAILDFIPRLIFFSYKYWRIHNLEEFVAPISKSPIWKLGFL